MSNRSVASPVAVRRRAPFGRACNAHSKATDATRHDLPVLPLREAHLRGTRHRGRSERQSPDVLFA